MKADRGSFKNPFLRNGDLIYIGRGPFNAANEIMAEVLAPYLRVISVFNLFSTD